VVEARAKLRPSPLAGREPSDQTPQKKKRKEKKTLFRRILDVFK
jgi:hypothetical protein